MNRNADRMVVDPKFKRALGIESMALGFPSVKGYTKYLAERAIKDNKRLKDLVNMNGKDDVFE